VRNVVLVLVLVGLILGGTLVWRGQVGDARAVAPQVQVALGASDAVGVGAMRPAEDGWVPLVAAGLPEGTQLVNLGVSGATLADMLADQLPVARDASPRWVTIWPAPNDFRNGTPLATFARQLDQLEPPI
jgi:lysophospholipase L1-like esterase